MFDSVNGDGGVFFFCLVGIIILGLTIAAVYELGGGEVKDERESYDWDDEWPQRPLR